MRILSVENRRFPGEGSSALGKSGPKVRLRSVADGYQVDNPELVNELMEQQRRITFAPKWIGVENTRL